MSIPPQIKVEFRHPAKSVLHLEKVAGLRAAVDVPCRMAVHVAAAVHLIGGASDKGRWAGVFRGREDVEVGGDALNGKCEEDGEARNAYESGEFHCRD